MNFSDIRKLISANLAALAAHPGFLSANPGLEYTPAGAPTKNKAIIVRVRQGVPDPANYPKVIGKAPVQTVSVAPRFQETGAEPYASPDEAEALATSVPIVEIEALSPYKPPKQLETLLNQNVEEQMTVLCHASPDAGWTTLKPFLQGAKSSLTIAMYDFSAPHISEELQKIAPKLKGGLRLVLDPKLSLDKGVKANDLQETDIVAGLQKAAKAKFDFSWAAVTAKGKTTGGIFPSAYHIKVAVRDHNAFWLSSGNWQSTNQPDIDPINDPTVQGSAHNDFNREWHVIIQHKGLASLYERFIKFDLTSAKPFQADAEAEAAAESATALQAIGAQAAPQFFPPQEFSESISVQPLLTPDNYIDHVVEFVDSAEETIDLQNQYIHLPKEPSGGILRLLQSLLAKQEAGIKIRIILRDIGDTRTMIDALVGFGLDLDSIRLQPNCHNKGLIVDGKAVLIGSHNLSSQGVERNRDASLLFQHEGIAKYYAQIFEFDWSNLASVQSQAVAQAFSAQAVGGTTDQVYEDGAPFA